MENTLPIAVADYRYGLISLADTIPPTMPEEMKTTPISLWHFLFACHNGRLFEQWLGTSTWLFVPVSGGLLLLNLLTGSWDWLQRRRRQKQHQSSAPSFQ
ncbi:MAG TPA: hypothetical protein ENN06_06710 [Desulfobacteraceae bacterium]|nr:hypothetical protein [Desulfobacteraceae bacterium]